ncbi:MAG: ABC transporter permease [Candidatus Cloacimonetes bacterium]|nr:ABC transporter permease [Candidatus Cloacimonadota bacterium]
MLGYYLKTALRNIKKNRIFSLINILGLSIGMAVCILIMLYVSYEYSYDKFHEDHENIYRVQFNIYHHGELKVECAAAVPAVGPAMKDNFPEVLEYCRAFPTSGIISYEDKSFREDDIQVVGPTFITMLSFPLIKGDTETALVGPNKAVITESTARKLFGDEDPLGKTITWDGDIDFEVTGVCADVPDNSHIKFTVLVSHDTIREFWGDAVDTAWGWYDYNTYVLLADGTDHKIFDKKFDEWLWGEHGEMFEQRDARFEFPLQPLTSIHLYSDLLQESEPAENGDGTAVKFLTIIAFFILVIAWVNYINLSTSKAMERAREVGVRKVAGANKRELIRQFLTESYVVNLIAIVISLVLVALLLPSFRNLVGTNITISYLFSSGLWVWIALFFVCGSFLSGLYPAFVLSSYKPIKVLKGSFFSTASGNLLRKVLVVFQFSISVILIAGAIIVFSQLSYLRNKKLGIDIEQTLVLKGPGVFAGDSLRAPSIESFRQEILSLADVQSFTTSTNVPGVEIFWGQGSKSEDQPDEDAEVMYLVGIDEHFVPSYDLELVAGTNFTPGLTENRTEALVNKSAVKRYGYSDPQDIIGRRIVISEDTLFVRGVIEDFNQMSLKTNIIPLAFPYIHASDGYFSVKIATTKIKNVVNAIQMKWKEMLPGNPFEYFFLDEHFDNQYKKDIQFGKVFGIFTALAIFIACLGLFALSSFSALKRTKEIGIRKILGATSPSIIGLLSKEFFILVIISICISVPITYFIMNSWLQDFAYRIVINWGVFVFSTIIVALIAAFTISFQTLRAANSNPVDSIKYE